LKRQEFHNFSHSLPESEKEKIEKVLEEYPKFKIFKIGQIISGNKKVILV
jgi:hypothetical protein